MTPPHSPGAAPRTPSTSLPPLAGRLVLMIIAAAVALTLPPRALIPLLLLGLFVGAVTRVGLWLVGQHTGRAATALAARAGAGAVATGLGVAGLTLLLGPATPDVLAVTLLVALLYLAVTRSPFRSGRP